MDNKWEGLEAVGVAIIILIGWGVLSLFGFSFGIEREGTVKYDDCRQIITIQDKSWQTKTKQFTCSYFKTKSGIIISGECVHTENDSSLFSSSHTCAIAYVYQKKQEGHCTDPTHPYLTYDDMCSTTQY